MSVKVAFTYDQWYRLNEIGIKNPIKFKNCSESATYVCFRTLVKHISIICYYSESVLEIV